MESDEWTLRDQPANSLKFEGEDMDEICGDISEGPTGVTWICIAEKGHKAHDVLDHSGHVSRSAPGHYYINKSRYDREKNEARR